jgi:hypothetical protein
VKETSPDSVSSESYLAIKELNKRSEIHVKESAESNKLKIKYVWYRKKAEKNKI